VITTTVPGSYRQVKLGVRLRFKASTES